MSGVEVDTIVCAEALAILAGLPDSSGFSHAAEFHDVIAMAKFASQTVSSAPVCPHNVAAEGLKKELYGFQKEAVAVAARNVELSGQLVALQAALDEERGKVMEAEFYQEHLKPGIPDPIGCATCILGKGWDKRHFWKREQWTEAARKGEG